MSGSRAPMIRLVSVSLLALAGVGSAAAADLLGGFVDMRLAGGLTGGANDLQVSDNGGATHYNGSTRDDFNESYRITLDWVGSTGLRSYGGWIWGIGGSFTNHSGRDTEFNDSTDISGGSDGTVKTRKATLFAWAADGFIGYAIPFGEHFQLEFLPFLGVGKAYLDVPQGDTHTNDANSRYFEGGFNVDAIFTTSSGFQYGLTGGYLHWDTSIADRHYPTDVLAASDGERFSFRADTWSATALIGVRF